MTDVVVKIVPDTTDPAIINVVTNAPTGIGPTGPAGADGINGTDGLPGAGVATGGTAGQILAKINSTNYNTTWIDNYTSQVMHIVKAGETMTKGTPVYVSSADGTNMIVTKASNVAENSSSKTLGLLVQSLSTNGQGYVVTEGLLAGLNTDSANAGDPVWLGANGTLIYGLANKPVAPAHLVFIGVVTRKQINNGEIFVRPQNGFEIGELHDVKITNPQPGDVLKFTGTLWVNEQP